MIEDHRVRGSIPFVCTNTMQYTQSVEDGPHKPVVDGSIPSCITNMDGGPAGKVPDCNSEVSHRDSGFDSRPVLQKTS